MIPTRSLFLVLCAAAVSACSAPAPAPPPAAPFSVVEASMADMQTAMAEGRVTSRQLVEQQVMQGGEAALPYHCFRVLRGRGVDVHLVAPVSYTHLTLPTNREM